MMYSIQFLSKLAKVTLWDSLSKHAAGKITAPVGRRICWVSVLLIWNLADPLANRGKSNHRPDQSRLSHPVTPEKGNHGPLSHLQGDSLEDIAIAVISMNIDNLKHEALPR